MRWPLKSKLVSLISLRSALSETTELGELLEISIIDVSNAYFSPLITMLPLVANAVVTATFANCVLVDA